MDIKTDTRNRQGSNTVAGYSLDYNIHQPTSEPTTNINCAIVNSTGKNVGNAVVYSSGKFYVSLDCGETQDVIKQIVDTIIDDAKQIFNEDNA